MIKVGGYKVRGFDINGIERDIALTSAFQSVVGGKKQTTPIDLVWEMFVVLVATLSLLKVSLQPVDMIGHQGSIESDAEPLPSKEEEDVEENMEDVLRQH